MEELPAGETIRVCITAKRWFDIKNTGWTVEVSSERGVAVRQEERNKLNVITLDPPDDDEV